MCVHSFARNLKDNLKKKVRASVGEVSQHTHVRKEDSFVDIQEHVKKKNTMWESLASLPPDSEEKKRALSDLPSMCSPKHTTLREFLQQGVFGR